MVHKVLGGVLVLATSSVTSSAPAGAGFGPGFDPFANPGSNWAGYVSTHRGIHEVGATWREPPVTCDSTDDIFAPWVGLDGWGNNTVEQTGVATDCSSGVPEYLPWYELWPAAPVWLSPQAYPVSAGDEIRATVVHSGTSDYLTIQDFDRNWTEQQKVPAPADQHDGSAEVVVEAESGHGYPDFGTVEFSQPEFNNYPIGEFGPFALDGVNGDILQVDTGPLTPDGFTVHYDHE